MLAIAGMDWRRGGYTMPRPERLKHPFPPEGGRKFGSMSIGNGGFCDIFQQIADDLSGRNSLNIEAAARRDLLPESVQMLPREKAGIDNSMNVYVPIKRPPCDFEHECTTGDIAFPLFTLPKSAKSGQYFRGGSAGVRTVRDSQSEMFKAVARRN